MGQLVSVVEKSTARPGVIRFEANRNLTGMGHEEFQSVAQATGPRPAALLAHKLLSTGRVDSVHMFGNIINVNLAEGFSSEGLSEVVRDMYQFWTPGKEMPTFDEPAPVEATSGAPAVAAGGAAPSEYERLVPSTLIERSRAALAKWNANH